MFSIPVDPRNIIRELVQIESFDEKIENIDEKIFKRLKALKHDLQQLKFSLEQLRSELKSTTFGKFYHTLYDGIYTLRSVIGDPRYFLEIADLGELLNLRGTDKMKKLYEAYNKLVRALNFLEELIEDEKELEDSINKLIYVLNRLKGELLSTRKLLENAENYTALLVAFETKLRTLQEVLKKARAKYPAKIAVLRILLETVSRILEEIEKLKNEEKQEKEELRIIDSLIQQIEYKINELESLKNKKEKFIEEIRRTANNLSKLVHGIGELIRLIERGDVRGLNTHLLKEWRKIYRAILHILSLHPVEINRLLSDLQEDMEVDINSIARIKAIVDDIKQLIDHIKETIEQEIELTKLNIIDIEKLKKILEKRLDFRIRFLEAHS